MVATAEVVVVVGVDTTGAEVDTEVDVVVVVVVGGGGELLPQLLLTLGDSPMMSLRLAMVDVVDVVVDGTLAVEIVLVVILAPIVVGEVAVVVVVVVVVVVAAVVVVRLLLLLLLDAATFPGEGGEGGDEASFSALSITGGKTVEGSRGRLGRMVAPPPSVCLGAGRNAAGELGRSEHS